MNFNEKPLHTLHPCTHSAKLKIRFFHYGEKSEEVNEYIMIRLKSFLHISIQTIFGLTIAAMLILCLFLGGLDYFCKRGFPYHNGVYLIIGLLLTGMLIFVIHFLTKKDWFTRYAGRIIAAGSLLMGVTVLILSYHYYFRTGWDSSVLVRTANNIAGNDTAPLDNWYYSIYPNNVLLTYLFSLIIRLCRFLGMEDYYFGLIVFQCILYAAGGYLIYRCADMLFDGKTYAVWVWILYIAMVGLSPWVVIPYSDSAGVFVVLLCFYLYLCVRSGGKVKTCLFLLTVTVYLGYKIKPQIVIIGIAMLLAACVEALGEAGKRRREKGRQYWKQAAGRMAAAAAGLLTAFFIMETVILASGLEMNEAQAFGWPHYLMMGLNGQTNGGYNNDDVIYSQTIYGQKERAEANLRSARERIAEYGASGMITFLSRKMLTIYNDGTFAWSNEGEFFQEMYEKGSPSLGNALKSYYYPEGTHFRWFLSVSQTLWMAVLFLVVCASPGRKKPEILVLMMAVVGLTMFEAMFEARARYLFAYVPAYILLAAAGIRSIIVKGNKLVMHCGNIKMPGAKGHGIHACMPLNDLETHKT